MPSETIRWADDAPVTVLSTAKLAQKPGMAASQPQIPHTPHQKSVGCRQRQLAQIHRHQKKRRPHAQPADELPGITPRQRAVCKRLHPTHPHTRTDRSNVNMSWAIENLEAWTCRKIVTFGRMKMRMRK